MEKVMNAGNLRSFAYVNEAVCRKPVRGIAVNFIGLCNQTRFPRETMEGEYYGAEGILYVHPYLNPWNWMNTAAVAYTDQVLDVLFDKYSLPEDLPVVASGGSMGGLSALVYTCYAKRTPAACVVNCPVCDAVFHYTERDDLPRTFVSALADFDGTLEEGLKSVSPFHLVPRMPRIPYHILHCGEDSQVNLHSHSERFVEAMREAGHDITFETVPGRDHCDLTLEARRKYAGYILEAVRK